MKEYPDWYVTDVNPELHSVYRWLYFKEKGTYRGFYSNWLVDNLESFCKYLLGHIKDKDDEKFERLQSFFELHAQISNYPNVDIRDSDPKKDYTRLIITDIPLKLLRMINGIQQDILGFTRCNKGRFCDMSMYFGLLERLNYRMLLYLKENADRVKSLLNECLCMSSMVNGGVFDE